MKARKGARLPSDLQKLRRKAVWLQVAMLVLMTSVVVLMYLAMGNSQAMKAAWLEDLLGLVPPAAFLIATAIERQDPSSRFPFGKYRAVSIAYLVSALALLGMGLFLAYDSLSKLLAAEHPTIGGITLFGHHVWLGWVMIGVLCYSMIPPVVIGYLTLPIAKDLYDKSLYAGSKMAKADWMTALAGIVGVAGIGFGFWWADAVAALVISADVLSDGGRNSWAALKALADEVPTGVGKSRRDPVVGRIESLMRDKNWVKAADAQFREEGRYVTGVVYVVPETSRNLQRNIAKAVEEIHEQDWRLYQIAVVPLQDANGQN